MKKITLMALLVLMVASASYAQYSKEDVLMNQARTHDRDLKITLLHAFKRGEIAVDGDSIRALGFLAGTGTIFRDSARLDSSDIRAMAITVLGDSTSMNDEARQAVILNLDMETHPSVLSASFVALEKLGPGDGMLAIRSINDAMLRNMARTNDNSVADDYLRTIATMVGADNPDMQTVDVLIRMSQGENGFSQDIRHRALDHLKLFW